MDLPQSQMTNNSVNMSRCFGPVLLSALTAIVSLSSAVTSQFQSPEFAVLIMPMPYLNEKIFPMSHVAEGISKQIRANTFGQFHGGEEPMLDDEIIVSSRTGQQAEVAAQKLMQMGYTRRNIDPTEFKLTNTERLQVGLRPPMNTLYSDFTPNRPRIDKTFGTATHAAPPLAPEANAFYNDPITFDMGDRWNRNTEPYNYVGETVSDQTEAYQIRKTAEDSTRRLGAEIDNQDQNGWEYGRRGVDHAQLPIHNTETLSRRDDETSSPPPVPIATYEEVLALRHNPNKLLVDVRTPEEKLDSKVSRSDESVSATTSSTPAPVPIATFEEVYELPKYPEKLLVGVRTPKELLDTGDIPTSINVPLPRVGEMFSDKTTAEQFRQLYGRDKPSLDDEIIVSCRTGRRAEIAAQQLIRLGYKNVKNYRGSWSEWAQRNGLPPQ